MIINRIFINKKTGDLIIIYCDWKNDFLEIYSQSKNKMQPLSLQFGYSVIPITQYIKTQLDNNWMRTSNLIMLNYQGEKRRIFSFRNKYYRQILNTTGTRVIYFQEITGKNMKSKDVFNMETKDMLNISKEFNNTIFKNIKTSQYIRDFNLFSMLKDL